MNYWFRQHAFALGLLGLFIVACCFFVYLTNSDTFADPDSFYHVKIAEDIAQGEDVRNFPWLPFTTLNDYYADQHYVYHVVLAPFVHYLGPFAGAKLATTFLAAALIVFFAFMLQRLGIRYPLVYGFLLLTVMPTMFRINLVKAPAFSILILLIGLLCAWKNSRIWTGVIAFLYVWSYGGFILLPLFVTLLVVMRLVARWWQESAWLKSKHVAVRVDWWEFIKKFFSRKEVHVFFAVIIGTCLGIVANPFFPDNLQYLNDQLIQIGIVNYQSIIQVGGEWYPFNVLQLIAATIVLTILLVIAIVVGIINIRRLSLRSVFFFFLYAFFLLFTIKSRRYVEYYGPFGMLFAASVLSDCAQAIRFRNIIRDIQKRTRYLLLASGVFVYAIIALAVVIPRDILSTKRDFDGGFAYDSAKQASLWLKEHTPEQSIVVHSSWDEFPYLLYWNDHNRYIGGLDPTFSYRKDEGKYWDWVNLTLGKLEESVSELVTREFQSGYILVKSGHDPMKHLIEADGNFDKVYEDSEATIYALRGAPVY